ncbi:MAG: transcriptional regulator GcvA [Dongiaceae bacterium]
MCRKSLPLSALRAFEVSARHSSFSKAADELSVSPAAIHHQIKGLSEQLGVELFQRRGRGLVLTKAGQACRESLEHGFDMLALAVEQARAHSTIGLVKIACCPSFAAKWLTPRLPSFHRAFPTIDIQLRVSSALVDFATDDTDLAIHYGRGEYGDLFVETLGLDELIPVCSPVLTAGADGRAQRTDIARLRLIHDDTLAGEPDYPAWSDWLARAGISADKASGGFHFENSSLALDAAIGGLGVALGRQLLIARDIAEGRLVEASNIAIGSDWAYHLIALPAIADQPKVAALREWIFSELSRPGAMPAAVPAGDARAA